MNIAAFLMATVMILTGMNSDIEKEMLTYGPGHENHQFAAWDNGDGTHSVACDCGIEKRIEYHEDKNADGLCDVCGYR